MCDVPTRSRYQLHYLERVWYAQVKGMASWQCCSIGKAKLPGRRGGRGLGALISGAWEGRRMLECPWQTHSLPVPTPGREGAEEQPLLHGTALLGCSRAGGFPLNPALAVLVFTFPSQQQFPRLTQPPRPFPLLPASLAVCGNLLAGFVASFFGWEGDLGWLGQQI